MAGSSRINLPDKLKKLKELDEKLKAQHSELVKYNLTKQLPKVIEFRDKLKALKTKIKERTTNISALETNVDQLIKEINKIILENATAINNNIQPSERESPPLLDDDTDSDNELNLNNLDWLNEDDKAAPKDGAKSSTPAASTRTPPKVALFNPFAGKATTSPPPKVAPVEPFNPFVAAKSTPVDATKVAKRLEEESSTSSSRTSSISSSRTSSISSSGASTPDADDEELTPLEGLKQKIKKSNFDADLNALNDNLKRAKKDLTSDQYKAFEAEITVLNTDVTRLNDALSKEEDDIEDEKIEELSTLVDEVEKQFTDIKDKIKTANSSIPEVKWYEPGSKPGTNHEEFGHVENNIEAYRKMIESWNTLAWSSNSATKRYELGNDHGRKLREIEAMVAKLHFVLSSYQNELKERLKKDPSKEKEYGKKITDVERDLKNLKEIKDTYIKKFRKDWLTNQKEIVYFGDAEPKFAADKAAAEIIKNEYFKTADPSSIVKADGVLSTPSLPKSIALDTSKVQINFNEVRTDHTDANGWPVLVKTATMIQADSNRQLKADLYIENPALLAQTTRIVEKHTFSKDTSIPSLEILKLAAVTLAQFMGRPEVVGQDVKFNGSKLSNEMIEAIRLVAAHTGLHFRYDSNFGNVPPPTKEQIKLLEKSMNVELRGILGASAREVYKATKLPILPKGVTKPDSKVRPAVSKKEPESADTDEEAIKLDSPPDEVELKKPAEYSKLSEEPDERDDFSASEESFDDLSDDESDSSTSSPPQGRRSH